jgi:(p)ppGpp synthase/HD superfamily hydrolase
MQGLRRDADMLDKKVQDCIQEAQRCVHRLEEIALKPNPISEIEYIEMLIEQEKNQKRRGYTDRIRALEKALKQAKIRADVKNM